MEFNEIKKIWDAQNDQSPYTIDEKALKNSLQRKRHSVLTSISEWLSIIGYLAAVCILVGCYAFKPGGNIFLFLEAAWMFAIVVYLVVIHIRRLKGGRRFDRSIHGDLDHAIFLISYQIRNAQILRWNLLPMGVILILSGWQSGKLFLVSAVILVVYPLVFYAGSKGIRVNKKRKRAVQALMKKLETGI